MRVRDEYSDAGADTQLFAWDVRALSKRRLPSDLVSGKGGIFKMQSNTLLALCL